MTVIILYESCSKIIREGIISVFLVSSMILGSLSSCEKLKYEQFTFTPLEFPLENPHLHFMMYKDDECVCAYIYSSSGAKTVFDEILSPRENNSLYNSSICGEL